MKKLILLLMVFTVFLFSNVETTHAQSSSNLINGDFSNGIPDGWDLYNESSVEQFDDYTRIYNDGSSDETLLEYEMELPPGTYILNIDKLSATDNFADANLNVVAQDYDRTYNLSGRNNQDKSSMIMEIEDTDVEGQKNALVNMDIYFDGGYNSSTQEYDYMDIGDIELIRTSRNLMEGTLDSSDDKEQIATVGDVGTVEDIMKEDNMRDAHIYIDNRRIVDQGEIFENHAYEYNFDNYYYDSNEDWYKLENENSRNGLELATGDGQVYVQGEVGSIGMDSSQSEDLFPMDIQVMANTEQESDDDDDETAYPLEDYYMYQWTVSENNIQDRARVAKDFGPSEEYTMNKMKYANIIIDDTEVVNEGEPTEETPNDEEQILDQYYESLDRGYTLKESGYTPAASISFNVKEDEETDLKPTEIRMGDYILDDGEDEVTVQAYLPKDTSDIESPSTDPSDPESPGGSADDFNELLTAFGMDTPEGNIIFVALSLIFVNITLVGFKISGMALPIVNISLLGLMFYGGFMPFWVMMVLSVIAVLMFIGLRGGMQQYE